jgi:hypothetical protein
MIDEANVFSPEEATDRVTDRKSEPVEVCLKCDAKKVNNVWYYRGIVPSHKPLYKHSICPECTRK